MDRNIHEIIANWAEALIPWLLKHGISMVFIALGAFLLNRLLRRIAIRTIRVAVVGDGTQLDEAEKKREETLIYIAVRAIKISILVIASMMILQEAGLKIGAVLASAGILGLAVGFGAQYLIRDIITGMFIILENQYRIGDVIKLESAEGTVEKITMRLTTLRDMNGTVHHVPHGEIKRVSNLSKTFARINLDIRVPYNTNLEKVIDLINKKGSELAADPMYREAIIKPPQFLRINEFAESAMVLKVLGETKPLRQWEITGELRKRLKNAFDEEGIKIAIPQLVIHQSKD